MLKGSDSACRAQERDGYRPDRGRSGTGNNPSVLCIVLKEFQKVI